jgi:protein-disulfide isomerase
MSIASSGRLRRIRGAAAAAIAVLGLFLFVPGIGAAGEAPDPALRQQVETIIQEYLRAHPEVVVDALREMERRSRQAEAQRAVEAIKANAASLFQDPASPVGGNAKGNVTLVEFFDYQCGYCKRVAGELTKLLAADPEIRFVYKELPILGPASVVASRAALAAVQQGKYAAFHEALMLTDDRLTEEAVMSVAGTVGLDMAKLKADMQSQAVTDQLAANAKLAEVLGIRGTPALVTAAELYPGAADLAGLKALIARARKPTP